MQVRDDAEMIFFNINSKFLYRPLKKAQTDILMDRQGNWPRRHQLEELR